MSRYILNEVETSHHLILIRLYFILTILITEDDHNHIVFDWLWHLNPLTSSDYPFDIFWWPLWHLLMTPLTSSDDPFDIFWLPLWHLQALLVSDFLWVLKFPPNYKIDRHHIAEILLKVALNTITLTPGPPRNILGPMAKGNLPPTSNSPNNDTQTNSTTVCHKQGISATKMNWWIVI